MLNNFFSLVIISILLIGCNSIEEVHENQSALLTSTNSLYNKSFNRVVDKFKVKESSTNLPSRQNECGYQSDPAVNCSNSTVETIELMVPASQKVYHPILPPFDCDYNIRMDIRFCHNLQENSSTIVFENFQLYGLVQPISQECIDYFNTWGDLSPQQRAAVIREMVKDMRESFEEIFMNNWVSDPHNPFTHCGEFPCSKKNRAVKSNYYEAACNKICLVYDKDCVDGEPAGLHCYKPIPCYSDGCCKKERAYCLNKETNKVEVCHEAYHLMSNCTNGVLTPDCSVEIEPCSQKPRCFEEGK